MHRALCQIKVSSINSAIAANRYITVSVCSLQHSHNYFTTKYSQIVHCNTPTGCSLQHTQKLFIATYPQIVHSNISTSSVSRTHPHVFHCNTPTLFTATHPQVVQYNTPTSCSLQHTHRLFTVTYTQGVDYNTPASGSLYIIPTCDYRQRTSCSQ